MKTIKNKYKVIGLILSLISCVSKKEEIICVRRPLTISEKTYFDSLKRKWELDSVDVVRVDFNNCDENGSYNVTFLYCSKDFVSQKDSIHKWSNQIVLDLYMKILSPKVAAVTKSYHINFEGKEKVIQKSQDIKLHLKPRAVLWYDTKDVERYTGVKYYGAYLDNFFKRKSIKPTSDSLILVNYLFSDGEDPIK